MSTWQGIQNPRKPYICSLLNAHIRANIMQQVHYIYSPICKYSIYGKEPGYLPTSEAITVMLCQAMSSLSRGCVVRTTPLLSSILKYLTPSSLLSKKYLLEKEFMVSYIHSRWHRDGKDEAQEVIKMAVDNLQATGHS